MLLLSDYLEQRDRRKCLLAREEVYSRASHCFAPGSLVFRKRRPDLYRKVGMAGDKILDAGAFSGTDPKA